MKRYWMTALAALMASVMMLGTGTAVQAAGDAKAEGGTGSVTIHFEGRRGDGAAAENISGLDVELWYVGTSGTGGTLAEEFAQSGLSLTDLEARPVSEQEAAARETAGYAQEHEIPAVSAETGSEGDAAFTGLAYGLYLIAPETAFETEGGSFLYAPFFVSLPGNGENDLELRPKTEWVPDTEPGDEPGTDDEEPGDEPGTDDEEPGDEPGTDDEEPGDEPGTDDEKPGDEPGADDGKPGDEPGTDDGKPGDEAGPAKTGVNENTAWWLLLILSGTVVLIAQRKRTGR